MWCAHRRRWSASWPDNTRRTTCGPSPLSPSRGNSAIMMNRKHHVFFVIITLEKVCRLGKKSNVWNSLFTCTGGILICASRFTVGLRAARRMPPCVASFTAGKQRLWVVCTRRRWRPLPVSVFFNPLLS